MKKFEIIMGITKLTDSKRTKAVRKMVLADLLAAQLPETFNLYKKTNTQLSVNHNKTRYAYT